MQEVNRIGLEAAGITAGTHQLGQDAKKHLARLLFKTL